MIKNRSFIYRASEGSEDEDEGKASSTSY